MRSHEYARDSNGRFDSDGRADERKATLVAAAAKLFAENGYHATSMAELSDEAGLGRGGVYHYIDSKLDLLFMIHEQTIIPLEAEVRAIDKRRLPAPETLRAFARALMQNISGRPNEVAVFLHEWKTMSGHPQWESVRKKRRELEAIVRRTFERGSADGTLSIADSSLSCLAFLGMINYSYTWFDASGTWTPDEVADGLCDLLLSEIEIKKV